MWLRIEMKLTRIIIVDGRRGGFLSSTWVYCESVERRTYFFPLFLMLKMQKFFFCEEFRLQSCCDIFLILRLSREKCAQKRLQLIVTTWARIWCLIRSVCYAASDFFASYPHSMAATEVSISCTTPKVPPVSVFLHPMPIIFNKFAGWLGTWKVFQIRPLSVYFSGGLISAPWETGCRLGSY